MAADVVAVLAQNLAFLRWLSQRVVEASTLARRRQFAREFSAALSRRLAVIDEVVVPVLTARGVDDSLAQALAARCATWPHGVETLTGGAEPPGRDSDEELLAFLGLAEEHLVRETAWLAPVIRSVLTPAAALSLGMQVEAALSMDGAAGADAQDREAVARHGAGEHADASDTSDESPPAGRE